MPSYEPAATRQDHELIDLLADAHRYSDEERAAAHWRADNPPPVGSDQWIEQQAKLHLLLEEAWLRNQEIRRRISSEQDDSGRYP